MSMWLDAFVPAFGLIALGMVLRRRMLRDDAVWAGMERLIFHLLMPALLVSSIASVDLHSLPLGGMAASIWITLLLGTALSLLLARLMGQTHPAATSVMQGGIRFNNLVAFAVTGGVLGAPGVALGGVTTGLIVPCVQLLLTVVFAMGGGRGWPRPTSVLRQVARNPLIQGCLIGFAFSLMGGLPPGLGPLLRALGGASVALGLLAVGAALTPGAMRDRPLLQNLVAAQKLLLMPLLTLCLARLLGLDALPAAVAVLFMAMPTATTGYVIARAMGGDAPLIAAMTTGQHVLAVLSLPFWVWLLLP
ncbi:AEC family transporter [Roseomonas gilardii]|uniref:AEC family transporter n=1 Tax=Roseomonas gilardii TaxID=257708 RepID=UPI00047FE12B|nr:AEC family transporter [Roseomonas gilardii]SUE42621.1 auxin efflux carrier [Roseomonas gilardii subsp. rosea]